MFWTSQGILLTSHITNEDVAEAIAFATILDAKWKFHIAL